MKMTVYRGTHEIGGNCVEVVSDRARIVIDVGMPLVTAEGEPFNPAALRGKSAGELLESGTLPRVPGLFDTDAAAPDAILLSHAHADHFGLIQYSQPTIPVHLSRGTSKMLLAGSIFAGQSGLKRERERLFRADVPIEVGDLRITAYPVDHSAFDSHAFLIEGNGKRVLYSGDLRLHGRKPGMARRLIAAVTKVPVDLMLMEGTHFSPGRQRGLTEHELEGKVVGHVQGSPGLVLAAFSPLHVDRLVTMYRAARQTGRLFVVDPYAAFVMHLVASQARIPRPTAEAGIRVCFNRHFDETCDRRGLKKIRSLFSGNLVEQAAILAEPHRYVMTFRPSMLDWDFGGEIPNGATCLYSFWSGYLNHPSWVRVRQCVESASGQFVEAHTSGHIFADDIIDFVQAINPLKIVPIHTFEPERFRAAFPNAVTLQDGEPMQVE